jgi:hypothetical protein
VTAGLYHGTKDRHRTMLCRLYPEGASMFELHLHRSVSLVLVVVTVLQTSLVFACFIL